MSRPVLALAALVTLAAATPSVADPIASESPAIAAAPATITVTVGGINAQGVLDERYSGYGHNVSPPVSWTAGPAGTRAYALAWEDPDAGSPPPVVHWIAWNIPAAVTSLPRTVRNLGEVERPTGMRQGRNAHGGLGYTGPHPPVGGPAHHYHVQVFALDRPLGLSAEADRAAFVQALQGRVIARGEAQVLFAEAAPRPPRA